MSYKDEAPFLPTATGSEFFHPNQVLSSKRIRNLLILVFTGALLIVLAAAGHHQYPGKSTAFVKKVSSHFRPSQPNPFPVSKDPRVLPSNAFLSQPVYTKNEKNGLYYPAPVVNRVQRANAALVSLVRNGELGSMKESMKILEDRFNRKFQYPWVFMNEEPFTEEFKRGVKEQTRSQVFFHLIPASDWDYPASINQTRAAEGRAQMVKDDVIYGGSESYRKMCRFNSGFFYRQAVLEPFDYYWRVEPGVDFYCDIDYDPFLFMAINKKLYGFTISLHEYRKTIESFWGTVQSFAKKFPEHIAEKNSMDFLLEDPSKGLDSDYNLCHFWSNFEIGDLRFYRSQAYTDYFDYLDATGNFFYERWGDAPVHSVAAALFLPTKAVHQFDDIAYHHNPWHHRPADQSLYDSGKCSGNPADSFDATEYSCMNEWWSVAGRTTT